MATAQSDPLFESGIQHHQAGRLADARGAYERVLAGDPAHADALHLLGVITHQAGRDSEKAVSLVRRAIALNPGAPEYHCNLGLIFSDRRRWEEAIPPFRRAVALRPGYANALNYLGTALRAVGRLEEAADAYRLAAAANPRFYVALSNLGNVLRELNRMAESADACRRAIAIKPDFAPAHNNLGNALNKLDRIDEAAAAYRRALELDPRYAEARSNLGSALKDLGRLDEAIAAYREALAQNPDLPECRSNLIYDLHYRDEFDPIAALEEARLWASQYAEPQSSAAREHVNDCDPCRRLKIGYISADFSRHSISSFLLPLLEHHDRRQFEIICYSNVRAPDRMTAELRGRVDRWRDIYAMTDERAAELIRGDGVDILVDLSGHTAQNRLLLLARRPAPVQFTWLGYPGTTGLSAIDYRLTDALADPPGMTEAQFSETLLRLPHTNWCYKPTIDAPPVGPLPALGRIPGAVCFGCFNNFAKITGSTLETWAKLLLKVPDSRLMIKAKALATESVRLEMTRRFSELGVAAERLDLRGRLVNPSEHLAAYGQVDIALDTYPYHGTTTTCEALWMGVPVVTLAGNSHVSRVGVSLLTNAGLAELIAQTREEYVEVAAGLAGDLPRLAEMRSSLRERMSASPLMSGPAFARDVEACYRTAWERWAGAELGNGVGNGVGAASAAVSAHQTNTAAEAAPTSAPTVAPISLAPDGEVASTPLLTESLGNADSAGTGPSPGEVETAGAESLFNRGKELHALGRLDEALACFERVLAFIPDKPEAILNIGTVLLGHGRMDEAIPMLHRALELNPSLAEAHYNLGLANLQLGRFEQGWKGFEYRMALPGAPVTPVPLRMPRWDGADLKGGAILIHAEQGLGDTIQFIRYVPEVIRRGGRVVLAVCRELERLLSGENSQGAEVVSRFVLESRQFAAHVALLSLPFVLGMREPPAGSQPYLRARIEDQARWRELLARTGRPRVGLAWAGNPQHKGDLQRSLPLAALAPLGKARATFFSLQVGPAARQIDAAPFPIIDATERIEDLCDTAGLIAGLDLVITVDTAVAHLAGAMGKETWVLLPFAPDWRWMRDRSDSPWYGSVRLFRQTEPGDWSVPIALASEELVRRSPALTYEGYNNLGNVLHGQGRFDEAIAAYENALRLKPDYAEAHFNMANTLRDQRKTKLAIAAYGRAIQIRPDLAEARNNLANVLLENGRIEQAIITLEELIRAAPSFPKAYNNMGVALQKLGRLDEAELQFRRAISVDGNYAAARRNLAFVVQQRGGAAASPPPPTTARQFLDLGVSVGKSGDLKAAAANLRKAIDLDPNYAEAHFNLGVALGDLHEIDEAIAAYRRAIELREGYAEARHALAMVYLQLGRFAEGWPDYEYRWKLPSAPKPYRHRQPQWRGEDLEGKTILLYTEQGMGDTLQFARYLPMVIKRARRVYLVCPPALEKLFAQWPDLYLLVDLSQRLPAYDFHCAVTSLPLAFGTRLETIPADVPYILPDAARVEHWKRRVDGSKRLRVGLIWAGNPQHQNDRQRSIPLSLLDPLSQFGDRVAFYGLQKGEAATQIPTAPGLNIVDLSGDLHDFADTAAAIACLDLVISVDTSVAHLAGALGARVWTLLAFASDWRWLLDRDDSPWYPTMRLFRQRVAGDWQEPMERVAAALKDLIE